MTVRTFETMLEEEAGAVMITMLGLNVNYGVAHYGLQSMGTVVPLLIESCVMRTNVGAIVAKNKAAEMAKAEGEESEVTLTVENDHEISWLKVTSTSVTDTNVVVNTESATPHGLAEGAFVFPRTSTIKAPIIELLEWNLVPRTDVMGWGRKNPIILSVRDVTTGHVFTVTMEDISELVESIGITDSDKFKEILEVFFKESFPGVTGFKFIYDTVDSTVKVDFVDGQSVYLYL